MNFNLARLGLCAALVALGTTSVKATPYSFTNLGSGWGLAINNAGVAAGISIGSGGYSDATAAVWNRGETIFLGAAGNGMAYAINNVGQVAGRVNDVATVWTFTSNGIKATSLGNGMASGINDLGAVVGYSDDRRAATLWNDSVPSGLYSPYGGGGSVRAINNSGQIAGYTDAPRVNETLATVWNGAAVTVLGSGTASAINNAGEVAWTAWSSDGIGFASVWNGRETITLGKGGAQGINNSGQVVGRSYDASGMGVATLWNGTVGINLNSFLTSSEIDAGWVLDSAFGINDSGTIIGRAYNTKTGTGNAFMLSVNEMNEIPEPHGYALLLTGLCLIGLSRTRQKNA